MAINFSLPSDAAGQKKLFIAILPILIFLGYYQLMHGKRKTEIETRETRLQQLEAKNNSARKLAQAGQDLQQKLALYEQHMKRLEQLIPNSEEVGALLNGLSERAMDTNVVLSQLKPERSQPGPYYREETFKIQVIGAYHDVGAFLAEVASLPRIITPVDLNLRPRPDPEARDGAPQKLNADFRIVTYVIPQAPEAPPAPGGASGTH